MLFWDVVLTQQYTKGKWRYSKLHKNQETLRCFNKKLYRVRTYWNSLHWHVHNLYNGKYHKDLVSIHYNKSSNMAAVTNIPLKPGKLFTSYRTAYFVSLWVSVSPDTSLTDFDWVWHRLALLRLKYIWWSKEENSNWQGMIGCCCFSNLYKII